MFWFVRLFVCLGGFGGEKRLECFKSGGKKAKRREDKEEEEEVEIEART